MIIPDIIFIRITQWRYKNALQAHAFVQFKHGADPDLAANPGWRSVMERSRDEARPLSTLPTPLFGTAELGYRIVWPVYEDGIVPEAVADRRARLRGFVAGSFTIDGVLNAALRDTPPVIEAIYFFVGRPTFPAKPMAIYSPSPGFVTQGGPLVPAAIPSGSLRLTRFLEVFGQKWTLIFDFDRTVLAPLRSSGGWAFSAGVLLLTAILLAYLAREQGYRRKVESTVAERTAELSLANSSLSQEIEERRRSEQLAKESEERLSRAQSLAHMGSISVNLQAEKTDWSEEIYRIFGVSRETFVPSMDNYLRVLCCLDIGGANTEVAHLVSITHLAFNRNIPLAREIEAYQRHRNKKLKRQRGHV